MFECSVSIFISHHRDNHNSQKEFKDCGNIGIEMPDVREVENSLISNAEVDPQKAEIDGSNQGNKGKQNEISKRQYSTCLVLPYFLELYR